MKTPAVVCAVFDHDARTITCTGCKAVIRGRTIGEAYLKLSHHFCRQTPPFKTVSTKGWNS